MSVKTWRLGRMIFVQISEPDYLNKDLYNVICFNKFLFLKCRNCKDLSS